MESPSEEPTASVVFDRAVGYYDRTRSHGVAAQEALTRALAEQLSDHQPVLEVGVGTGRIARPLATAGVDMVGLDLSAPMLATLIDNAGGEMPFPLVRGDAPACLCRSGRSVRSWPGTSSISSRRGPRLSLRPSV